MERTEDARQYWDGFYQEKDRVWSGRPNPLLVREVAAVPPGTALDLGCGEGADAIWLAKQGWRVTASDVSATALDRAAVHAADAGVRVTWVRHDLSQSFPDGAFDLVSAQFLHSPVATDGEREKILRRAAGAVAPGGLLLIAGHASGPTWAPDQMAGVIFPTTEAVLAALDLDQDQWRVELQDVVEQESRGPDGEPGTRKDNVLRISRLFTAAGT